LPLEGVATPLQDHIPDQFDGSSSVFLKNGGIATYGFQEFSK
jgi:hypothetical protein